MNSARKKQLLLDLGEKHGKAIDEEIDLYLEEIELRIQMRNLKIAQEENKANSTALLDQIIKICQS